MKNYLTSNAKLKRSGIYSFGIPAYQSADGFRTCPGAKDCIAGCYARNGFYVMPSVKRAQEERLALSKKPLDFVQAITDEIKRRKIKRVRIHDSGDFYSRLYLSSWILIMLNCPETQFYAYTKMIPLFHPALLLPENFRVIFSYGGKYDTQINPREDRHSAIFDNPKALKLAGYADASHFDHVAAFGENHRIGLVYHGPSSRNFTASAT